VGLNIKWNYHSPQEASSVKVERINQTLEKQITKLTLKTILPWTKCLPIANRIRTVLKTDVGLSSYEMLYRLPSLGTTAHLPTIETKDQFVRNYILAISSTLSSLRLKGLLAQMVHHF
jgi:hypothetical protein